jgi:SAM-dependent methyltransferase
MDYARAMAKRYAPAAERNKEPILKALRRALPRQGTVLEIASGTGQHAAFFAVHLPELIWQPTDRSPEALRSIEAWVDERGLPNLLKPITLDVCAASWPIEFADAVLCINMIHVAPWGTTEALFAGASRLLRAGTPLVTYGPYRVHGLHTAPSNQAFDESLRARDPRWGVRDIDELIELGDRTGFALEERIDMPANNMTIVWTRHR